MIEVKTLQEAAFEQLREALHRLAADGLVVFDPQRGARVADFNSREVEQMYDIRTMLEGYAAQRAAARMTPDASRRLAAILDKMDAPDISPVDWVGLNGEFHDGLYAC